MEIKEGMNFRNNTTKEQVVVEWVSSGDIGFIDGDLKIVLSTDQFLHDYTYTTTEIYSNEYRAQWLKTSEWKMQDEKMCDCKSIDLFRFGCKCGGK